MKLLDIINGYKAVLRLYNKQLPLRTAYSILKIKTTLEPYFKAQQDDEVKLVNKYNGTINGDFLSFENQEICDKFNDEISVLLQCEKKIKFDKVNIPLSTSIDISAAELEMLDKFVNFTEV